MEWLNFLRDNWAAIKAAPLIVVVVALAGGGIALWLMRIRYEGQAAANRAELKLAKAELQQARETTARGEDREAVAEQRIAELSDELNRDRARIDELEQRLSKVPDFTFSDQPPGPGDVPASDNALWIQFERPDKDQS